MICLMLHSYKAVKQRVDSGLVTLKVMLLPMCQQAFPFQVWKIQEIFILAKENSCNVLLESHFVHVDLSPFGCDRLNSLYKWSD